MCCISLVSILVNLLVLSQHKSGLSTSSVGQSGPFKYACLVIEARPIDWSGSQGSHDLLYGDSIALIGVYMSKMLKSAEFSH